MGQKILHSSGPTNQRMDHQLNGPIPQLKPKHNLGYPKVYWLFAGPVKSMVSINYLTSVLNYRPRFIGYQNATSSFKPTKNCLVDRHAFSHNINVALYEQKW